eukprot:757246-Alexandrium_andersonii.AAC.1
MSLNLALLFRVNNCVDAAGPRSFESLRPCPTTLKPIHWSAMRTIKQISRCLEGLKLSFEI